MKTMNGIHIIGVDHGYGNIKTANCCFPTGVESSDTEPTFKQDLLIYEGRYYQIGIGHKEYAAEKIMDQDYYVLTLAAIARELAREDITEASVYIAAGLPLSWVGKQKQAFKEYLLQNREVAFTYRNREYHLRKDKVAEFIDSDLMRSADIKNWDALFKAIMDTPFDTKPVIVLDEFQYLGKANPAFPSIFQRIWEEILKDKSVMVILCGSLISMMESQTLSYDSPLYGRRTAQIRLKQIPFSYYHEFFPSKSRKELIEMYAVTGGVPKYIELFSESKDIYTAIQKCVLNRSGYLYDEPHFLLQQEVSEVGSYFSIIRAIAAGNRKLSEIASLLEIKATSLTKYLKTLSDLDILEREVPITEDNPEKSKKGLYKIKDNYLRFWFAFVYPNMSFIESGHSSIAMNKIRKSLVVNHTAFVYEDVCRERMWDLNGEGAWPFHFTKLGSYWDSNTEIDIAALDPEGKNLILGECKYWKDPVGLGILRDLEEKAKMVTWERDHRKVWYVLFSANGFTEELLQEAASRVDLVLCAE